MTPRHAKLSHMHLIPYKLKNDRTWIKQARQGARWEHLAKSARGLGNTVFLLVFLLPLVSSFFHGLEGKADCV